YSLSFGSCSFCAAKKPVGCGVHNLVVPLSFRCLIFVRQPAMLLKRRAFDQKSRPESLMVIV
ncbi:hypothetical protein K4G97_24045, partial [Mycobacterium tuberculosis]|nr:hypothetical protein [Mycobacterium tuberculosis]MBZ4261971.1 hypothetical protein [Mycobacterium tuberculosis]